MSFANNLKFITFSTILVLIGQFVGKKHLSIIDALPGAIILMLICLCAIYVKKFLKFKGKELPIPIFAWAIIIAMLLTLPYFSFTAKISEYLSKIDFLATTTPLLAFVGISTGNQLGNLKKLSWKIVLVALVTFTCVYFGGALMAEMILRSTGVIK